MSGMKPLCMSLWRPPTLRPQAILLGKMVPEWIRQGVSPVVVSYANQEEWKVGAPIEDVDMFNPVRGLGRIPPIYRFFERRYWARMASLVGNVVSRHGIDVLFSFAYPMVSNIVGAMVKQQTGVPFVSHFSDPHARMPFRNDTPEEDARYMAQERFILEQSDAAVFVNDTLRDKVVSHHPNLSFRAEVIPHCYDPALYPAAKDKDTERTVFSHIGAFYGPRNPETIFKALRRALDASPVLEEKILFRFIGALQSYSGQKEDPVSRLAKQYGLSKVVSVEPAVDYEQSLGFMKASDYLLVIDADFENSPFLPSKVIDYAGAGAPILAVTPKGSPSWDTVSGMGGLVFSHGQVEALSDAIESCLADKRGELDKGVVEQYSVSQTTSRLMGLFSDVLK